MKIFLIKKEFVVYLFLLFLFIQNTIVSIAYSQILNEPFSKSPFEGTWVYDKATIKLTPSTFYLKFPFQNGIREIYGNIISHDIKNGHIVIKHYSVVQDGNDMKIDDKIIYMTYKIEGNILLKAISSDKFPKEVQEYRYIKMEE